MNSIRDEIEREQQHLEFARDMVNIWNDHVRRWEDIYFKLVENWLTVYKSIFDLFVVMGRPYLDSVIAQNMATNWKEFFKP